MTFPAVCVAGSAVSGNSNHNAVGTLPRKGHQHTLVNRTTGETEQRTSEQTGAKQAGEDLSRRVSTSLISEVSSSLRIQLLRMKTSCSVGGSRRKRSANCRTHQWLKIFRAAFRAHTSLVPLRAQHILGHIRENCRGHLCEDTRTRTHTTSQATHHGNHEEVHSVRPCASGSGSANRLERLKQTYLRTNITKNIQTCQIMIGKRGRGDTGDCLNSR